jgi:hypothetical protein
MLIDSPRPGTSLRVLLRRRRLNLLQTEAFYLLEKLPEDHRPEYLALYNLALNAALLLGSLTGPFIAGFVGVPTPLAIFAVLRFLAALAILRWE